MEESGESVSTLEKHRHGRQYALSFDTLQRNHGLFTVQLRLNLLPEVAGNTKLDGHLNLDVKSVSLSSTFNEERFRT